MRSERRPIVTPSDSHVRLVQAFQELDFEFEQSVSSGARQTVGFSDDGVLEVVTTSRTTVSLLVSSSTQPRVAARCATCLATVASVMRVEFMEWLAGCLKEGGRAAPWRASRAFGSAKVSVEYFCTDAILVSVQ